MFASPNAEGLLFIRVPADITFCDLHVRHSRCRRELYTSSDEQPRIDKGYSLVHVAIAITKVIFKVQQRLGNENPYALPCCIHSVYRYLTHHPFSFYWNAR
jgi:hypothetical protein